MSKKLNIYFGCSIMGEPGGAEEKEMIVSILKNLGHTVLSEIFVTKSPNAAGPDRILTADEIYHRDMNWLYDSDVMVADVARVSLGVGFEMGWMLGKEKKVIALCRKDRFPTLSNMIKGCRQPGFSINIWENKADLRKILKAQLGKATV